jgi:proteasome lid subunit RPN8/RPN11
MKAFRGLFGRSALVRFQSDQWRDLVVELGRRGGGVRESGAFLLTPGEGDGRRIQEVAFYDDLDPSSLVRGIALGPAAYGRLWRHCRTAGLRVAGDVHTHPTGWVDQSEIDRSNPMVALPGHVALILPDLACHPVRPADVGVHRYDGRGWRSWCGSRSQPPLYVGRWP